MLVSEQGDSSKMLRILFLILAINIIQTYGYYEWSPWSICDAGCTGERSRSCDDNPINVKSGDSCDPPGLLVSNQCSPEDCGKNTVSTTVESTKDIHTIKSTIKPTVIEKEKHCHCGCKFTDAHGVFQTYFKKDFMCTWSFEAEKGFLITVKIERLEKFNWNLGNLYVASPEEIIHKFQGKQGGVAFKQMGRPQKLISIGNKMNFTLQNQIISENLDGVDFKFTYHSHPDPLVLDKIKVENKAKEETSKKSKGSSVNVPLIASIGACVLVILLAIGVITYRKMNRSSNENETEDEKAGFFGGGGRKLTSPRNDRQPMQSKVLLPEHGGVQLVDSKEMGGGYLSGQEMYYPNQPPTFITGLPPTAYIAGQQYINWPLPGFTSQQQMAYPYKQSFEHITSSNGGAITPMPMFYPTSGGEG